eukprot:3719497-Amphidinium_carterae.2
MPAVRRFRSASRMCVGYSLRSGCERDSARICRNVVFSSGGRCAWGACPTMTRQACPRIFMATLGSLADGTSYHCT